MAKNKQNETAEIVTSNTEEVVEETEVEETETTDPVVEEVIEETDAAMPVTKFAVYRNGVLFKIFNSITHGSDFKEIAKALAARLSEEDGTEAEAKPYIDEAEPEIDPNVSTVVNASNNVVREYSLAVHGKDYKKIAASYIEKHGEKRGYRLR